MQSVGEKYGLHKVAPAELTRRKDAPVFVVTESTDEAAIKEQFSSHGSVKGFGENLCGSQPVCRVQQVSRRCRGGRRGDSTTVP